jgi:hypothetical protein
VALQREPLTAETVESVVAVVEKEEEEVVVVVEVVLVEVGLRVGLRVRL